MEVLPSYEGWPNIWAHLIWCHSSSRGVWLLLDVAGKPKLVGEKFSPNRSSQLWDAGSAHSALIEYSGWDSLPSSSESRTLPLCYWFEHFPKQHTQESSVDFAIAPTRQKKCLEHKVRLKYNCFKWEMQQNTCHEKHSGQAIKLCGVW